MSDESPVLDYREPDVGSFDRRILEAYLKLHGKRPTVGRWLRISWKMYLAMVVIVGSLLGLLSMMGTVEAVWVCSGMFVGAMVRDLGTFRATRRTWPVLDRIIDWRRVEELVALGKVRKG